MALPCWQDVWADANALGAAAAAPSDAGTEPGSATAGGPRRSAVGDAAILGVAEMLGGAVFDSQRQVLLAPWAAAGGPPPGGEEGAPGGDEVERRLRALLAPYSAFFGRQHLAALLELEGDWAVQALLEAALERFDEEQVRGGLGVQLSSA